MHVNRLFPVVILSLSGALGCGGSAAKSETTNPNDETHKGNNGEIAEGLPLYVGNCAKCHGPTGKGTDDGPALVGRNALSIDPPPNAKLRKNKFNTAQDLFDFIKPNMPLNKGGSLSDEQYYTIIAFTLKSNGMDLHDKKVDAATASTIVVNFKTAP